ncbi:flavin reductase family protein [Mammaliicoccus sciuri]|jgi:flavin reductase (DIM6/NTAB) family NADH-FMN oxidoreductase RutF|uniref:flavin reductase family protein n=1 Tax=Mammaliicoccus sciuri TaxID=1296 RepID=UPI00080766DD|nr:flavin reductase family protein [Mammaliicoccus sciuri]MBF0720579.1 flavin reductase family protein [Mammaliicoccus sciuri]MBF0772644.1 flavin reductase family protein [Mammaliicoccus sciuri]MBG9205679.1 flavin reductase family protein [Mammaliicoccus sciuri]MBG9209209.1 flavin reductase family protein [Mammaliicoccus sciuri]MCD5140816.1 flavin reductase family protein [Mammaliicoccus sciuri]
MKEIRPEVLSQKENYKLLIGSIIPRPIALVTTESDDNVLNIAPFSFFNVVSSDPPILSIAVQRVNGEMKDTARNIIQNKEAVVHIVDTDNVRDANQTAALLSHEESELERTNFETVDSVEVSVKGLKQSKVRFEAVLYDDIVIEKDGQPISDLLLLEVKYYHFDERIYNDGYINKEELNAVSRLAGNDYAEIGHTFTIERP